MIGPVALAVERGIDRVLTRPVSLRRDIAPRAARSMQLEDRAGVIFPVRDAVDVP
ncbi:hypothetical protein ACN2XU_04600 [Primorskyibacter sp. 2E107]|uniref:hypothetical protein n=1 Tax=Primorskyibacter sp. 2E107 TaxID=3403458 RepID=UPI003AF65D89